MTTLPPQVHRVADIGGRAQQGHQVDQVLEEGEEPHRQHGDSALVGQVQEVVAVVGAGDDERQIAGDRKKPIQARGESPDFPLLGVIDPHEAVVLHQHVPDIPGKAEHQDAVQAPIFKPVGRREEERRRQQEAPLVTPKELAVAVGPDESGEVMTEGQEGQQEDGILA